MTTFTMTTALWCVLVAGVLPFLTVGIAKFTGRATGGYLRHNDLPRDWLAQQQGMAKRAHAAHLNGFEAFPLFAAGVIIAQLAQVTQGTVNAIAITFVIARLAYIACYLADQATLRSLVWMVGLGCSVGLFIAAGFAK